MSAFFTPFLLVNNERNSNCVEWPPLPIQQSDGHQEGEYEAVHHVKGKKSLSDNWSSSLLEVP